MDIIYAHLNGRVNIICARLNIISACQNIISAATPADHFC